MSSRLSQVLLSTTLIVSYAFSQTVPKVAPLPYDPLELATGPTVVPDTPEQRAVLLNLLERARQNSAMHTPGTAPFTLKVSFNSTGGDSHSQGYGEVEETWLNGQTWRWSARLGDYSQLRIFYEGAAYDDKPRGHIPLRLQMVRNAIFWPMVGNFAPSLIRMATAKWEGTEVACILISRGGNDGTATPGRRWEETNSASIPRPACCGFTPRLPAFIPSTTTTAASSSTDAFSRGKLRSSKAAPACCRSILKISKTPTTIPTSSCPRKRCSPTARERSWSAPSAFRNPFVRPRAIVA